MVIWSALKTMADKVVAQAAPPRVFQAESRHGATLPFVIGTARVKAQLVYQGTPSGPDFGQVHDGSVWRLSVLRLNAPAVYAVCEAPVTGFAKIWKGANPATGITSADFAKLCKTSGGSVTAITADSGVSAWANYVGTAAEGMGHQGTAHLRMIGLLLESDGTAPVLDVEVTGHNAGAGGESTYDAHPADVLLYLLTDSKNGLGLSSADVNVNTGIGGTVADGYRRYCSARGWYVSRAVDSRTPVVDLIASLLLVTDSTLVLIDGVLTAIPYGDQTITRGSFTFTPTTTATVIDADELIHEGDDPPIEVDRAAAAEIYGVWPVTYVERAQSYETVSREYIDPVWTSAYGIKRAEKTDLGWVLEPTHAFWVTTSLANRSIYQRNVYRFRLGPRWSLLTPMDFVSLSEPTLGISSLTVRILSTEEREDGDIEVEAVQWSSAVAEPIDLTQQAADGVLTANLRTVGAASDALDNVADGAVRSGLIAAEAVIPEKQSAASADTYNLWPNPTSEVAPPAGYDPTHAAWNGRVLSGSAHAGSYVRSVSTGAGAYGYIRTALIPTVAGEIFYFQAYARMAGGNGGAELIVRARDASLGEISYAQSPQVTSTSWTSTAITYYVPTGAVWITAELAIEGAPLALAEFDSIILKRGTGASAFSGMVFVSVSSSGSLTASAGDTSGLTTSRVSQGVFRINHSAITASAVCVVTPVISSAIRIVTCVPNASGYVTIYMRAVDESLADTAFLAWLVIQ